MTNNHNETECERELRICEYLRNQISENYQEQLARANNLDKRVQRLKAAQRKAMMPFIGIIE